MRIGRTIPPAATPIQWGNIFYGILGAVRGDRERERFAQELKEFYNKKHCFLVSSGKAALTLILEALKACSPDRNKVLIPAFTCYSVPSAIYRAGLEVTLCDISKTGFDFDIQQIKPLLEDEKLLCVIPTHLYGIPADIENLRQMIGVSHATVVEDVAQAMGSTWRGRKLGTLGDISFFSMGRGKAFSTVEGGIILTDRDDIAFAIAKLYTRLPGYSFGEVAKLFAYTLALKIMMHPNLFWIPKSIPFLKLGETIFDPNFKMRKISNFQAGLSKGWIEKLNILKRKRKENALFWQQSEKSGIYQSLISQNEDPPDMLRFPIKILEEEAAPRMLNAAEKLGLGLSRGYPDSIDGIGHLTGKFPGQRFPQAKEMAKRLLTLPMHTLLSKKDLLRIRHQMKLD